MREIKFRCWNKETKSMHRVDCLNFFDEYVQVDKYIDGRGEDFYLSQVELMQSVEMVDKNGRLIFEGDILRDSWNGEESIRVIKSVTEIDWLLSDGFLAGQNENDLQDIEVIGNIYENKELLG